ncbi:ABC transporter permease, partial [bacterium]|nr:ABC transporter permease [bacterium]
MVGKEMELILATLRLATPLIFASLGGVLCERAGIATICLEGIMLVAAFAAGSTAVISGSSEMALFIGVCSGCFLMGLHELLTQKADADPVVSGMAINILALGLTPLLSKFFFDSATNTPSLPPTTRLHPVPLPLLGDLPTVGILFKQSFLI